MKLNTFFPQDITLQSVALQIGELTPLPKQDLYVALLSSIVSQQLSIKAAATIWQRFENLFPSNIPTPDLLLVKTLEELRAVGLSQQKAGYLKNIAEYALKISWKDDSFHQLTDQEIIKELTTIKGVGQWTVEMLLIFAMNRPDVFSVGDLGIKQAMVKLYGLENISNVKELQKKMLEISEKWQPNRSLACRYLWKWKDAKQEINMK